MKLLKNIAIAFIFLANILILNAQEVRLGVGATEPLGDFGDITCECSANRNLFIQANLIQKNNYKIGGRISHNINRLSYPFQEVISTTELLTTIEFPTDGIVFTEEYFRLGLGIGIHSFPETEINRYAVIEEDTFIGFGLNLAVGFLIGFDDYLGLGLEPSLSIFRVDEIDQNVNQFKLNLYFQLGNLVQDN